ncbi:MAG TPA: hypothetical protein VJ779_10925 [Acetobacteraceae bacterium]|nr:hypothetical protein [Acetobacteraceae bacterium]
MSINAFSFESFEKLSSNKEAENEAQRKFLDLFPIGSKISDAQKALERAGAACQIVHDNEDFLYCIYRRRGHGLQFFVGSIEWRVVLWPDSKERISRVEISRNMTGF